MSDLQRLFPSTGVLLDQLLTLPAALLLPISPDPRLRDGGAPQAAALAALPGDIRPWRAAARPVGECPPDLGLLTVRRLLARPRPADAHVEVAVVCTRPSLEPATTSLLAFADEFVGPPLLLWARALIPIRGPRLDLYGSRVSMLWDTPSDRVASRRAPEPAEAVQLLASVLERVFLVSMSSQSAGVLDYILDEPVRAGRLCELCAAPEDRGNPWAAVTGHAVTHISARRGLNVLEACVDTQLAPLVRILHEAGLTPRDSCEGDPTQEGYMSFTRPEDASRCASWARGKVEVGLDGDTVRFAAADRERLTEVISGAILRT